MTNRRLGIGLACYAALGLIGTAVLEGDIRLVLWIFLAGLAAKSYVAWLRARQDQ